MRVSRVIPRRWRARNRLDAEDRWMAAVKLSHYLHSKEQKH